MGWFWFLMWTSRVAAQSDGDASEQNAKAVYYYDTFGPVGKIFFLMPAWGPAVLGVGILLYCYFNNIGVWPLIIP